MKRRSFLLLALLALALAGCKVDATVSVRVNDDGSGVVRVNVGADAEAVKTAESGGVKLEQAVRLGDLIEAGWKVSPWNRATDGSATIELARRFTSVDEVDDIMRDVAGPDGPLRDFHITRERGLFETSYSSSGLADLTNVRSGVAADPELVARLSGQQVDVNAIDQQLLAQVKASFGLKVVVKLPGQSARAFAPTPEKASKLSTSSKVVDVERIVFAAAAFGFLALAIVVTLRSHHRSRHHSRSGRRGRGRRSGRFTGHQVTSSR